MKKDSLKILLLDDDIGDQLLFKKHIENISYEKSLELFNTSTPDEALQHIETQAFDLAFIDYNLGTTTGMEFIQSCVEKLSVPPFILLTGTDRPDLYQFSSELNVYDYLLKSDISPSLLLRSMVYTLQRASIEHDLFIQKEISSSVINASPDMIIELDQNYNIISHNPAVLSITGYNNEELKEYAFEDLLSDDYKPIILSAIKLNDLQNVPSKVIAKNKKIKTVYWTLLKNTKTESSFFILGHDMTKQMQQEKKQRQDEKIKALGHLAGGVAHEINNLLQPVILNSELLKDSLYEKEDQEILGDIFGNAKLAAGIVEDILIFARQDMKTLGKLNFLNTLDEAISVCRKTLSQGADIQVINHSVEFDTFCYITHEDLTRVILNLIQNASDAMNSKGLIEIHLRKQNDSICIDFIDSGCGIPTEDQEIIFNAFYTTKPIGQGTGLGLTMVYNLIKGWGGELSLESAVGKGSTFSVTIPIIQA